MAAIVSPEIATIVVLAATHVVTLWAFTVEKPRGSRRIQLSHVTLLTPPYDWASEDECDIC